MKSKKYIKLLENIDVNNNKKYDVKELVKESKRLKKDNFAIEVGVATEVGLLYAFDYFNVDDAIFEGFAAQYPRLAEKQSLYHSLIDDNGMEISSQSMTGFLNGIKGKVFENELVSHLNEKYDGYEFGIAESATQPIWDLKGINASGQEILVQAKMGGETYVSDIHEAMVQNPDVLFATSTEIQEKILEKSPELASQFVGVDISNVEFTTKIEDNLEQLVSNYGVDVPDGMNDFLPLLAEATLVIKLLKMNTDIQKQYQNADKADIDKVRTLKAIVLVSRYGVTTVSMICGAKAGALVDVGSAGTTLGLGTLFGGIGGAIGGAMINKKIEPRLYDLALAVMGYDKDDLFYLKNKAAIDEIGNRLRSTYYSLHSLLNNTNRPMG